MRRFKQFVTGGILAVTLALGCVAPVTAQAADEFGGGRIVIDPENQNEDKPEYMPGACINYYDGLKSTMYQLL